MKNRDKSSNEFGLDQPNTRPKNGLLGMILLCVLTMSSISFADGKDVSDAKFKMDQFTRDVEMKTSRYNDHLQSIAPLFSVVSLYTTGGNDNRVYAIAGEMYLFVACPISSVGELPKPGTERRILCQPEAFSYDQAVKLARPKIKNYIRDFSAVMSDDVKQVILGKIIEQNAHLRDMRITVTTVSPETSDSNFILRFKYGTYSGLSLNVFECRYLVTVHTNEPARAADGTEITNRTVKGEKLSCRSDAPKMGI